jgi:hypothetical protein
MVSRNFHAMRYATDIMEWMYKQTGKQNVYYHTDIRIDAPDVLNGGRLYEMPAKYMTQLNVVDSVFTGHNSLPMPDEIDLGWPEKDSHEYTTRSPYIEREINFLDNWYSPLTNLNKRQIAELYRYYDIMDLAMLTNSCSTEYGKDSCKKCFACREKFWGFGFY